MSQIDTKTKQMKGVEGNDLQNYVSNSRENASKRASQ
jgi:hypothetical protein